MSTATLSSLLPAPSVSVADELDDDNVLGSGASQQSLSIAPKASIPPYGQRSNWKPRLEEDFADGGAYPECHLAQYPRDMGRKKSAKPGSQLSLQVDAEGNVRYDAIVQQGRKDGQMVQSRLKDTLPMHERDDMKDVSLERPDEASVMSTAERTRLALEKITQGKIKAAQPKHVSNTAGNSTFVRYTPGAQGAAAGGSQRIIKMTEQVEDPLEPAKFRFKKNPRGDPSPPPPVLRSPPRKVTAAEQKEWMIPPCISNWKNNKGYTIPLDKRLAADGRGLQDVHINDGFAHFSEALHLAERHSREEVHQRSIMQQKLAQKEKAAKEEHLRALAQRARDERAGIAPSATPMSNVGDRSDPTDRMTAAGGGSMPSALAAYGSDSDSDSSSEEDDEAARERDRVRAERKRDREREMRMASMGSEQRARMLAREQNRDISEKVALGLAKPTNTSDQVDSRLFNQESYSAGFGDDESYNTFDKPLFQGSSAAQTLYRRPAGNSAVDVYAATEEAANEAMRNDRFGLGKGKAFEGADLQEERSGPVQFEKDTSDPFAIDAFLDDAKRGTKRSGIETASSSRAKRQKDEDD
ncbi:hypothetical protein IE81DRAFT_336153 [Ceraceosorus guamensis]|uniref:Pre-mRNA-processing protein 45 n=1 Tax=Ceraceosorus guamensis TaxID=1522189 RepID=A0A316W732_9BASI|nr:hypothetical protein IE81DRAFT_336153 [Ceraceosorus guamensis]PWN45612.1 hypothetical protein IE81DRAFT_336153 [Ceraceosorus guamensis]